MSETMTVTQDEIARILDEIEKPCHRDEMPQRITLCRRGLELMPKGLDLQSWATLQAELGDSLAQTPAANQAASQEEAIAIYREVLSAIRKEEMPVLWRRLTVNLANVLSHRLGGQPAKDLEDAIALYEQACHELDAKAETDTWVFIMNNLASAYTRRVGGIRADNIEKSIEIFNQVLAVQDRRADPEEWARLTFNQAIAYLDRIRGDRAENIERSIGLIEEAAKVITPAGDAWAWANLMNSLANGYTERIHGPRPENLQRAAEAYRQALEVLTPESFPFEWAQVQDNLGLLYADEISGDPAENIELAIHSFEQALSVRQRETAPFYWAATMHNLANAYRKRVRGDRAENIERAIETFWQALSVRTRDAWPAEWAATVDDLANAYVARVGSDRAENLTRAIELLRSSLEVRTLETAPVDHLKTQSTLGRIEFTAQHWDAAHDAFSKALAARDLLYAAGATPESRQHYLEEASEIHALDACCLARLGRIEEGVLVLERARARALRESLARNEAALGQASAEHRETFLALRKRIAALEAEARGQSAGRPSPRGFLAISSDLGTARQELARLAEAIRSYVPGFMPVDSGFPEIAETAAFAGLPLVYLATVYKTSLALIVPPAGRPEALWLPDFTGADLDALLFDQNEPRYLTGAVLENWKALQQSLDAAWPELKSKLLTPLAGRLTAMGFSRAALIAMGTLDLLPLPAITPSDVLFTPVPSARALSTACRVLRQRSGSAAVFLGVGDPRPSSGAPLPSAAQEVEAAAALFPSGRARVLLHEDAKRETVLAALPGATHLHFACHGRFDPVTPLDSELSFAGDGRLTWRDILDGALDLSAARVAVLSACQSGIKDYREAPDEMVGFPSAFLQAGVPGVLSTLWPVQDLSTGLLLARFYKLHLLEKVDAAEALRQAQQWLSTATTHDLEFAERWERIYQETSSPEADKAKRYCLDHPLELPFAHPYYWAGFVFSGAFA